MINIKERNNDKITKSFYLRHDSTNQGRGQARKSGRERMPGGFHLAWWK